MALGLDARNGLVAVHGWTDTTGLPALKLAKQAEELALPAIIYTDIARDGMMAGPNLPATRELANAVSVPVIHSGGVTTQAERRGAVPAGHRRADHRPSTLRRDHRPEEGARRGGRGLSPPLADQRG